MLGEKVRNFKTHTNVSIEDLVPADNFYRQLDAKVDLSFVHELVRACYCPFGRPSIDPIVFFKLQLIMFFEGIRSERQLMKHIHLNLAFRWYIGYDLDESVPHHSSLTRIRERFGWTVFQRFFDEIVQRCIEVGLVWGQELHFDGSMILANANFDNQVPRFYQQAQKHLGEVFDKSDRHPDDLIAKYDGTRELVKPNSYRKVSGAWVNPGDETATKVGNKQLGYRLQYAIDGGKARIILKCLVTPAKIQDNMPFLDLLWRTYFRWQLPLRTVVADTRFGTVQNVVALEQNKIRAFMPLHAEAKRSSGKKNTFPTDQFHYDAGQNVYICPQGETLRFYTTDYYTQRIVYKAGDEVCHTCSVKLQCKTGKSGRRVGHSMFKPILDRVTEYQQLPAYQKAMRKRQVWVEPKFGELKQWHLGSRYRLRGLFNVNIEALIKATGQNIKQLIKAKRQPDRPNIPSTASMVATLGSYC